MKDILINIHDKRVFIFVPIFSIISISVIFVYLVIFFYRQGREVRIHLQLLQ